MNKEAIIEAIEKSIRRKVILVDKESVDEIKIPDGMTTDPKWLARRIMQDLEDSGELASLGDGE